MNFFTVTWIENGKKYVDINFVNFRMRTNISDFLARTELPVLLFRYNENLVAKRLGVNIDTPLSLHGWKTIRRQQKIVPRRFSKQFVAGQLQERNEYRRMVRMLQSNPDLTIDFPYNVCMPIRVGSMVTAFCRKFQIIQRGRVLAYERAKALYLVEFESDRYGYEWCPDSDVATCGKRTMLIRNNKDALVHSFVFDEIDGNEIVKQSITGSAAAMLTTDVTLIPSRPHSLLDDVANYDAFLSLLNVIDIVRNRKRDILLLIEDANTLAIDQLPFGVGDDEAEEIERTTARSVNLSPSAKDHLLWLQRSLERTNLVLYTVMDYFRTLYGESFIPVIEPSHK
jgi:hypothetical protein